MEDIFQNPGIRQTLGRYVQVVKADIPAQYKICRNVETDDPPESHKKYMKKFWDYEHSVEAEPNLLDLKISIAEDLVRKCGFCGWNCGVDRKTEKGRCGVGYESRVDTAFSHWGEEEVLIPSGTIFFTGCNWGCVYCQNYSISQFPDRGSVYSPEDLARWIDNAENINVNFVGGEPTPNLHNILKALRIAERNVPIVWNSNMYMSRKAMELLAGVIDVYLADFRYGCDKCALEYSKIPHYLKTVKRNLLAAIKQGEMIIRVLVLPGHAECCTKPILDWIVRNLDNRAWVNIMSQYTPHYKAQDYPEINRRLFPQEYAEITEYAKKIGLVNFESQQIPYF